MNSERRPLDFASLDDVMPDVESLMTGHATVGKWTLGQICEHLATVKTLLVNLPADTRSGPLPSDHEDQKRKAFETGQLPEGMDMPGGLESPNEITAAEAAERLRQAIAYYKSQPAPVIDHPLFGPLNAEEWYRLMCIHSAHHLSFALPSAH